MASIRVASFNVFGIEGRSTNASVEGAATALGLKPGDAPPELLAIGFQEVYRKRQLQHLRSIFVGDDERLKRGKVDIWAPRNRKGFRCLVPRTRPVVIPVLKEVIKPLNLELSSGLALCVRGKVLRSFFQPFRGGFSPDRFSSKGVIGALVRHQGQRYALLNTHLHNSDNDHAGRARANQIDQLAAAVQRVTRKWRAPIILLGDFNVDAKAAYGRTDPVAINLFARLLRTGHTQGAHFFDLNGQAHDFQPLATNGEGKALDLHLLSGLSPSGPQFDVSDQGSDHLLTIGSWS